MESSVESQEGGTAATVTVSWLPRAFCSLVSVQRFRFLQVSKVISVCAVLANNSPCEACNLLEMFSDSFQCPPQQLQRLAAPSHLGHVNTFLSRITAYCTLPFNNRSQRKMLMVQRYSNVIIRVPTSLSNIRQRTDSKGRLLSVQHCKWGQSAHT